jgi:hypothetical protein
MALCDGARDDNRAQLGDLGLHAVGLLLLVSSYGFVVYTVTENSIRFPGTQP